MGVSEGSQWKGVLSRVGPILCTKLLRPRTGISGMENHYLIFYSSFLNGYITHLDFSIRRVWGLYLEVW